MTRAVFIGIALALFLDRSIPLPCRRKTVRGYAPCPARIMYVPTSRKIQRCIAKFLRFKKVPMEPRRPAHPTGGRPYADGTCFVSTLYAPHRLSCQMDRTARLAKKLR